MEITITEDFIAHRTDKSKLYNRRNRSENKFLMDLDAEILEFTKIKQGQWLEHDDWRVDGINEKGLHIDVKFISKWYNLSNVKMLNILQQRDILDGFEFYEWSIRPNRPMREGDKIEVTHLGYVDYDSLADNIKVSRGKWGGFYADPRGLLGCS